MTKTIDALVEALQELMYADTDKARRLAEAALAQARAEQAEPYAYVYEYDHAIFGIHRAFAPSEWNGMKPSRIVPLYTTPPAAPEQAAAVKTLTFLRYTYHGGELWKPPLGSPPAAPVAKPPNCDMGQMCLGREALAKAEAAR